jgi:hypothetical protein
LQEVFFCENSGRADFSLSLLGVGADAFEPLQPLWAHISLNTKKNHVFTNSSFFPSSPFEINTKTKGWNHVKNKQSSLSILISAQNFIAIKR